MNVQEAKAFAAIRKSRTPAEIEAFHEALMADHDAIARYDWLKENLPTMSKEARKAIFAKLDAETAKYPGMSVFEDPLFGRSYAALRSKIGLFRGVKWDRNGKLRLSPEAHAFNIQVIKAKIAEALGPDADLTKTWGQKVENLKADLAYHEGVLAGTIKTDGSIWDRINPKKEG